MKSHVLNTIRFVTGEIGLIFLLLALAIGLASIPVHAQDGMWKVDGEHSLARLSLGSGSKSTEVGVARVSGNAVFGASGAADPVLDLNIQPDEGSGTDDPKISFRSKRFTMTNDGKMAVVGDLSLTRIERSVTLDANEGYYGGVYGEPVVHTDTREVTLVLPGASLPAAEDGAMQLSASTNIRREYFPELMTALAPGNWRSVVVEDQNCTVPSAIGEGYFGAICTGTPVATRVNSVAPATGGIGEGYYGFDPAVVPDASRATIALDLKLTPAATTPPAAFGAAGAAGN